MPVLEPVSGRTLDIEDRFRSLITLEPSLFNLFFLPLFEVTPETATIEQDVIVALFTSDDDFEPEDFLSTRTRLRFVVDVLVAEPEGASQSLLQEQRRKLVSITEAIRDVIWKYRQDPTPGECYWWHVKFIQNPTTLYSRTKQRHSQSRTQFDVYTQKANL